MSRNYKKLLAHFSLEQPNVHLWRAIIFAIAASLLLFSAFFAVHPRIISVTADAAGMDEFDFAATETRGNYDELARDITNGNDDQLASEEKVGYQDQLASEEKVGYEDQLAHEEVRGNAESFISRIDTGNQDMLISAGYKDLLAA